MIIDGEGILVLTLIVIFVLYISIKLHLKKKVRNFVYLEWKINLFQSRYLPMIY